MHRITEKLVAQYAAIRKSILTKQGYFIDDEEPDKILMKDFNLEKRMIAVKPREVFISQELHCPKHLTHDFSLLQTKIQNGENINGYQSLQLNKVDKHDYLVYDWNIHHLHFDDFYDKDFNRKKRSKELLFTLFSENKAYLIAIKDHDSFNDVELLNIIDRNWSYLIKPHLINGSMKLKHTYAGFEISQLRKTGINTFYELESRKHLFSPGGGIAASGDSADASMNLNNLYHSFEDIVRCVFAVENGEFNSSFNFQSEIRLDIDEFGKLYICDEASTEVVPLEVIYKESQRYKMYNIEKKNN